ncbi:MAG: LPS-assembly protein LptD [Treponema sp.]|nr:LPS-assembly protein LptD [Treponema sp.]
MKKILFLLLIISPLYAQETSDITDLPITTEIVEQALAEAQVEAEAAKKNEETIISDTTNPNEENELVISLPLSEIQRIEMELKTSTLSELAVWARRLGLSEGGTRDELSRRIRNHFQLAEPTQQASANQKIITIESAQMTDYFSIDVINEDYARLRGDVNISLKDGDSIHRIQAQEILFNRTRNILTASGGVRYEKIDSDKTETFRGESITVNIDNWSSVFLDGSSVMEDGGTSYRFSGKIISRTDQDVTILSNAKITSGANEDTFWSISATRLWLLPGSDFAIANAVLKVGEIPVLYIPFFFFPTDQLIFHPVIGYRSREGGFIQTTTYILGQPKAETKQESSLSKILGNSGDSQLEREGIFLRSTGKKIINPNELSLKAMIDYYVNLGLFLGVDLAVPRIGILNPLTLNLGIGFTRTVTNSGGIHTPYAPDFDGTFQVNRSNLFSLSVPFRYRFKLQSSISGKYGSLSWDLPYHSDPFVDKDFMNRAESMDWAKMLTQGAASEEETINEAERAPYTWTVSGNLTPSFPKLSPYLRMSPSNISMSLGFKSIASMPVDENNILIPPLQEDPGRIFYAPDKFTIYSISSSISGTPLTLGGAQSASGKKSEKQTPQEPLLGIGTPIPPWSESEKKEEKTQLQEELIPPVLRQSFTLPNTGNLRFTLDYSLTANSFSELQFWNQGSKWNTFEKVDWSEIYSILTSVSGNANINLRFDHSSGLFSNTVTFRGEGSWRDYSFLNEDAFLDSTGVVDTAKIEQTRRQQFNNTNYRTSYSYSGKLQPLFNNLIFRSTSIDYTFGGTLVRSKRYKEGESPADGPELSPVWGAWVKEEVSKDIFGLNSHQIGASLAANVMEKSQNLTFNATLPPLDESFRTGLTLRFWVSETTASFQVDRITENLQRTYPKKAVGDWGFRPITIRETLRFNNNINFNYNMTIDPENDFEVTHINSSLRLWYFNTSFTANKLAKVDFIQNASGGGWVNSNEEPSLHPSKLDLSYAQSFSSIEIVKNLLNLNFNINTSLSFDLHKFTNSNFHFSFGFTLKLKNILDITLSASSNNNVIARYFKAFPGMDHLTFMYPDGDQNNIFIDLWDSFSFWDKSKRERSGFKMGRFGLKADHYLGDWTATLDMTMSPWRDTTTMDPFKIIVDFSFFVKWTPITEIKSGLKYDGKTEKWARMEVN